jgi:hypothetical protein
MANLNFSRRVKVHYPAAQFDVQFIINDGNPNDVGIFTLVYDRFFGGSSAHSEIYFRWCFSDLATARAFMEQFGGEVLPSRRKKVDAR